MEGNDYRQMNDMLRDLYVQRINRGKHKREREVVIGEQPSVGSRPLKTLLATQEERPPFRFEVTELPGEHMGSQVWTTAIQLSNFVFHEFVPENALPAPKKIQPANGKFSAVPPAPQPPTLVGHRVLELGAGCGLVGMTAGAMGAKETILTDKAELLTLLQSNVARNQHYFANKVAIQELDWKNTSGMHAFKPPLDFIFAAGIFYDEQELQNLLKVINLLANEHTSIFLAFNEHKQKAGTAFLTLLKENKFFTWDICLLLKHCCRFEATLVNRSHFCGGDVVIFQVQKERQSFLLSKLTEEWKDPR